MNISVDKLNSLSEVPFEQWRNKGVSVKAVSASANGFVHSGILRTGQYFYRKWSKDFSESRLVFEER